MATEKTIKEVHKGEKCKVMWRSISSRMGSDGGYTEDHIEVTDETSEAAYKTAEKIIQRITSPAGPSEEELPINKRASKCVDVV